MLNVKKTLTKILSYLKKSETRTLLWTNLSPSSSFSAQTVLDSSVQNYDYIEVTFGSSAPNMKLCADKTSSFMALAPTWANIPAYRSVTVNSNGVTFSDCYAKSQTVDNGQLKPDRIYGIKVGGGTP